MGKLDQRKQELEQYISSNFACAVAKDLYIRFMLNVREVGAENVEYTEKNLTLTLPKQIAEDLREMLRNDPLETELVVSAIFSAGIKAMCKVELDPADVEAAQKELKRLRTWKEVK